MDHDHNVNPKRQVEKKEQKEEQEEQETMTKYISHYVDFIFKHDLHISHYLLDLITYDFILFNMNINDIEVTIHSILNEKSLHYDINVSIKKNILKHLENARANAFLEFFDYFDLRMSPRRYDLAYPFRMHKSSSAPNTDTMHELLNVNNPLSKSANLVESIESIIDKNDKNKKSILKQIQSFWKNIKMNQK